MNSALEVPLEVLALDSLSYGFLAAIKNLWAWVAIITGTVSFFLTFRKADLSITDTNVPNPKTMMLDAVPEPNQSLYLSATSAGNPLAAPTIRARRESVDWTTRRKFVRYYQDDNTEKAEAEGVYDMDCAKVWNKVNEQSLNKVKPVLEWELDMMRRMRILTGEEMRWYRYQDLTLLNGNVVRLWESCR